MYYLKLMKEYMELNIAERTIYDRDFIFGIIALLIKQLIRFSIFAYIYQLVPDIKGWYTNQLIFLYGVSMLGFSVWESLCINFITLPYYIKRGEFDRFLLRPLHPLLQIACDGFDDDSWGELIVAVAIVVWSVFHVNLSFIEIISIPVIVLISFLVYCGISILLSSVSFYTVAQADIANLTYEISDFAKYPMTIFPGWLQLIFTFVFPIGFAAYYPVSSILKVNNVLSTGLSLVLGLLISTLFLVLSVRVWNMGCKHYSGCGT